MCVSDIVNSPKPDVGKPVKVLGSKLTSRHAGGENKAPREDLFNVSSWLNKDSKLSTFVHQDQDEADQCKQQ